MRLYPAEGSRYLVTEWDGSQSVVRVVAVTDDSVLFHYEPDGPTHEVHPDYFVELNPHYLPPPRSSGYHTIHLN